MDGAMDSARARAHPKVFRGKESIAKLLTLVSGV